MHRLVTFLCLCYEICSVSSVSLQVRTLRNVNIGGGQVVNIQVKKTSANIKCRIGAYCSGNDPIVVFHDDDRVCAECMAHYTRNEILNGKPFIKCPGAKDQNESHPCQKEIPFHVAAAVCGLTKQVENQHYFLIQFCFESTLCFHGSDTLGTGGLGVLAEFKCIGNESLSKCSLSSLHCANG